MSVSIDVLVNSTTYALSGRNPFAFISLTGAGLPPVRRIKERGPLQHGATDVGFLLDERMLNLALLITGSTLAAVDEYRDDLAEILKPLTSTPLKLRVTRDDSNVRQIDCYTTGIVDFPNTLGERIGASQMVVVQFEAAYPIWYDPELVNIFVTNAGGSGYLIPLDVPMLYTTGSAINRLVSLEHAGQWEVYPKIYATGPATDLVITNETTGDVLDFTGHSIAGGDTYEIDLRYGYKTITDQNGTRKNSALTDDSDLATWRIVPTPTAAGGFNDIRVEVASGVTNATQIRMEYSDQYPTA